MSDLVPVRAPDGTVGTVPKGELAQALEAGAVEVSAGDLAAAQRAVQYGGIKGEALAGAAGAARGLTFGLSDAALTELDPSLRDPLNALREVNPTASSVGEIAGAVAPALVSGGSSLLARGATALPRGAMALGGAAERGAAALVGRGATSVLGAAAQGAARVGARGAVEGALYGAGHEVSEAALGDYAITADHLLAGSTHGALAGLALGGGLGALEGAGGAVIGKLRARLDAARAAKGATSAAAEPGALATTPTSTLTEAGQNARVPSSIVEKYADSFENAEQLSNAWRNRAKLFAKHDDTIETATRSVAEDLSTAVKSERAVDAISFGEAKAAQMADLVEAGGVKQAQAAYDAVDRVRARLADLAADPTRGGAGVATGRLGKWVEKAQAEIQEAWTTSKPSELFMKLDDLKRAVGKEAQFGKTAFGLSEGAREFRAAYDDLRSVLEDSSLWGKAAEAQNEINRATELRLGKRDLFQQRFLQQYGSTAGVPEFVGDPAKIQAYVSSLTSARNDLTHQSLVDYIKSERGFLDAVEKHYAMGPAERANVQRARKSFEQIEKTIDSTAKSVAEVNAAKRLMEEERAAGIGGLTGAVVDIFTKPMTTLARLADIERTVQRVERRIDKGVGVFFKRAPTEAAAPRLPASAPMGDRYDKAVRRVEEFSSDPAKLTAHVAKRIGDLAEHAPNVSGAAASLEARKVAFLASKIPPGHRPTDGLQPHMARPRVTDAEKARFLRYEKAATDPLSVVADLESGRVSREAVEAIRELHPAVYETIRARVAEQVAGAKGRIPYQKQIQLGILFDTPTHPSLEPAFIRAMQRQWSDKKQQPNAPSPRPFSLPKIAGATASERQEER